MLNSQWSSLWAIMGVLLIHSVAGVHSLCSCSDIDTEVKKMECLRACRMGLSNESPVYPGSSLMQFLTEIIKKYTPWIKFVKNNSNVLIGEERRGINLINININVGKKRKNLSSDSGADLFSASSETQGSRKGDSESHQESHEKQKSKRSFAMEHFRWAKPVGWKRRRVTPKPNTGK